MTDSVTSVIENLSVKSLLSGELSALAPNLTQAAKRDIGLLDNSSSFFDLVRTEMDKIIDLIQSSPRYRRFDSENRTSIDIVNNLKLLSYNALHDSYNNGNVDIIVKNNCNELFIEAKNDDGSNHLLEGFRQLADRYLTKYQTKEIKPLLLIYCKKDSPSNVMENWKKYLNKKEVIDEYLLTVHDFTENSLRTIHKCKLTNKMITIEHVFISLKDFASDKSARGRKGEHCPNCGIKES